MTMLDIARKLGLALATSEEFSRMSMAMRNLREDPVLVELLDEYQCKKEKASMLMESGSDNVLETFHDLDLLQNQLMENPIFLDLIHAENDFQALLYSVNEEIAKCISMEDSSVTVQTKINGFREKDSCLH